MELAVGIAIVVGLVVIRHLGARRFHAGDRRAAWLVFLPTLGFACLFVGVGVMVTIKAGPVGILVILAAITSLVLLVRAVGSSAAATGTPGQDAAAFGEGPWFDYIVWGAIGVPCLFIVVLVAMAIGGALSSAN